MSLILPSVPLASAAPSRTAGYAPARRPRSVRRTSTVEASWPQGVGQSLHLDARGRDLLTDANGRDTHVLAWDCIQATLSPERVVEAIRSQPVRHALQALVGTRTGGPLRRALDAALPDEREGGSPLYLLIDDFAGLSLIAPWARAHWPIERKEVKEVKDAVSVPVTRRRVGGAAQAGPKEGVCIGFRPGASALQSDPPAVPNCADVPSLVNPGDPVGWHALPLDNGMSMRRSRRIDVWREGNEICIDAMFQDSAYTATGTRKAVHEYTLEVGADAQSLKLSRLQATPRVLPFPECPAALENINRLLGVSLLDLRTVVLERLPKTLGCTHLNDALRALAEVPMLIDALSETGLRI